MEQEHAKFIVFGDVRIKLNNIKSYGIQRSSIKATETIKHVETKYYEHIFEPHIVHADQILYRIAGMTLEYRYNGRKEEITKEQFMTYVAEEETASMKHRKSNNRRRALLGKGDKYVRKSNNFIDYLNSDGFESVTATCDGIYTINSVLNVQEDIEIIAEHDESKQKSEYLYVTTYQGDNFRFLDGEVDFNIYEKLKKLDEAMGAV